MQNKFVRNTSMIVFSQCIVLAAGILTSLFLPKLMTVTDYANYKIYTMYLSYIGLFHLGFNDGVYLRYGGCQYQNLSRRVFRRYSRYLIWMQSAIALLTFVVALIFVRREGRFILAALAISVLTSNVMAYYQCISQITQRFREFSYRNIIRSVLTITIIGVVILTENRISLSYQVYIVCLTAINLFLVLWYSYTYQDIICGKCVSFRVLRKDIRHTHKMGLPLMFSNLLISVILAIDRQYVSVLFPKSTFASYSFAYNLLSIATTIISAISVVLYPMLREKEEKSVVGKYGTCVALLNIFIFTCMLFYFPFITFLKWFLPDYADSIPIFRIILPGLALSCPINIVIYNYYKIIGETVRYFKICCGILAVAIVFNTIGYMVWGTPEVISWASIISSFVWYLWSNRYLVKKYELNTRKNSIYMILLMLSFYLITALTDSQIKGFAIYATVLVFTTGMCYNKSIKIRKLRGRLK